MNALEQVTLFIYKLRRQQRHSQRLAYRQKVKMGRTDGGIQKAEGCKVSKAKVVKVEPLRSQYSPPRYRAHRPFSLVFAVVCLTGTIGHRFYNKPKLDVGTKAPYTIIAPMNALVPDSKTTEENRKAARLGSVPVLKIDTAVNEQIYEDLLRLLNAGKNIRDMLSEFPFVETSVLSRSTQLYLRSARSMDWQAVFMVVNSNEPVKPVQKRVNSNPKRRPNEAEPVERDPLLETLEALRRLGEGSQKKAIKQIPPTLNAAGYQAIFELQQVRKTFSGQEFLALLEKVSEVRRRYFLALAELEEQAVDGLKNPYDINLLALSDSEWQQTTRGIYKAAERLLASGVAPGLPQDILRAGVVMNLRSEVPEAALGMAADLLMAVLRPNLVRDPERTRAFAERAAQEVKTAMVRVERGEVIVGAGETISQRDFVLLDYFDKSQRQPNWLGLVGFGMLVAGAVGVLWLVERRYSPGLRRRDHILVLLLTLSLPVLVALQIPYTSLPAIGLLVGSFYGSAVGLTVVGLLAGLLPMGLEIDAVYLIASAAGGMVGGWMAGRLRSREELAFLGCGVALTQGVVYLVAMLILTPTVGTVWYVLLNASALQGLAGLVWSVVALGLSAYLEHLFDLVTPVRLAELANPNRHLLKRLASEAPGTFQHTLFVATLAEAAAKELGCNVELVRTGTLYHDIGKMHDPLGFIENQMGGPNKHDLINDPWKSAAIIKKHVSEGLVMAKKGRLPAAIKAFIPEHQGTMLIAYFYHHAQQLAKENPSLIVREEDFRYDGPIPQSRETGILMLADSCEAALRSLKDASPEEALNMVNKILRARWQDHQLVDSGLMKEDLLKIAAIFVEVWLQVNHKRIAYPKAILSGK